MAPKKRPSDGSQSAKRQKKTTGDLPGVPADALALPHLKIFEQWAPLVVKKQTPRNNKHFEFQKQQCTSCSKH